jgi:integrase
MATGHIRQRGKASWELKYEVPGPATGRRRTCYRTVKGTKRDAQRELRKLLNALDEGQHVEPTRLTVAALLADRIERWRASGDTGVKTAERHRELARHQIGRIGGIQLQKLTTLDIEAWHAGMLAAGLSPRTIGHAHRVLQAAMDDAVKHNLIPRNVARLQRPPKVADTEVEIVKAEEIAPMLAELEGHALYPAVVTSLYCGMRRGELLAPTWQNADLDAKVIRVRAALEETTAGVVVKEPKTKAGKRDITLPEIVVDALRDHRRQQLELRMALGAGRMPDDALVFPGLDFGYRSPRGLSTQWQRTAQRLALPKVTWHALRHTHASMLIAAGVDIATIAKRLGHASPATTLKVYAHCFKRDDRAAADAIDALVRRP